MNQPPRPAVGHERLNAWLNRSPLTDPLELFAEEWEILR